MSAEPVRRSARGKRLVERTQKVEEQAAEVKRKKTAQWHQKRREACKKQDVIRQKKKEAARSRREAIKLNTELYEDSKRKERERWHKRRAEGKVKTVAELNERERRKVRRKNREYFQKHSMKKKQNPSMLDPSTIETSDTNEVQPVNSNLLETNGNSMGCLDCSHTTLHFVTSGKSDTSFHGLPPPTRDSTNRKAAGRKKINRDKSKLYKKINSLEKQNVSLKRSLWRTRKTLQCIRNKTQFTPRSKVRKFVRGKNIAPEARKQLVFGEVCHEKIVRYLKLKSFKEKQVAYKIFSGSLMKHYKLQKEFNVSQRMVRKFRNRKTDILVPERAERSQKRTSIKQVHDFFMSDENSIECADKRSFVYKFGKDKLKRRKRYLRGTLKDLYSSYCQKVEKPLSYSKFCEFKPFNVVKKDLKERDTCLCTECENMELLVSALHRAKALEVHSNLGLLRSICCSPRTDKCYQRKCDQCKDNKIEFLDCDSEEIVTFKKWVSTVEKKITSKRSTGINTDGSRTTRAEIAIKRTTKKSFQKSVQELQQDLLANCVKYFKHVFRDTHQTRVLKEKRENLGPDELYVWIDYAANWSCNKYDRETQSHYYGASHEQVVMHTGMAYKKDEKHAFITLSESSRKDPSAILTHLTPVLKKYMTPEITKLHLQSDSPSTQYRNKTMFYLATKQIPTMFPQLTSVTHNFTEAGHGKGGKSAADEAVRNGEDVPDYNTFGEVLKKKCTTMFIETVDDSQIEEVDQVVPSSLTPFKGTMEVHQYNWSRDNPNKVHFNGVSCYSCEPGKICNHYKLKNSPWSLPAEQPHDVSDSDDDVPLARRVTQKQADTARTQPPSDALHRGDWVAVQYGNHWYPGVIEKTTNLKITVNFMVKHTRRDDWFLWPKEQDKQTINRTAILYKLKKPPVKANKVHFMIPEREYITSLMTV